MSTAPTAPAPESITRREERPFGWRDKIGYMFGDFGNDFTFVLQSVFFMIFYTNVMGINPAHVGTLLFGARILDAFTDVGAGRLIDTLRPAKSGRFRPWLLRIAVPVALAGILMFTPVLANGSYAARLAWMIVTYVLWGSVAYTLINIPYGSMASVISSDPGHRASLSVFRSRGATLAQIGIAVLLPAIVYVQIDGQSTLSGTRMMLAAIGCGLFAVLFYVLCFLNVTERVHTPPKSRQERLRFVAVMRTLITNRALTGMIAGSLFMLIAMMLMMSMVSYTFNDYFNNGQLLSLANFISLAPTLLLVPVAAWLARHVGKREIGVAGMCLATTAGLVLFVLRTDSATVFITGMAVLMLGIAALNILIWAFITDVIDVQEIRTGERNDATVYALYSWARKLGQALAGGLSGWALGWIGYEPGGVQQTASVLEGIYSLTTLVPTILLGISALILALWYPLSKSRVEHNVAILRERRAEAGVHV